MSENSIYNPASQSREKLIESFVVRTNVFEKLFKDILSGPMKYPEQHYIIQGQRGMGKTTLLLRLKYEVESTPELNSWLVPVFFSEESYDLTSLSNLWEKLLKYLDELWNTDGEFYEQTEAFVGKSDYESKCFDLLQNILEQKGKKLIIFFDNFISLFLDHLSEKEQRRFREILMNNSSIRIIGASAVVSTDLHDYSKPFYEFFKIINLEGLSKEETFNLIKKLQEKSAEKFDLQKNKAKIDTLAVLTGGVIRTVMLIYEVVLADVDGSALKDLESILDKITPLYKHRIEDLPVQQRKIVDVIAKSWDAISTKDISKSIRENGKFLSSKIVSAQLQQLEKNMVVIKKSTTTKNHLYQLNERFFNIWYLMRLGSKLEKSKVIWLTRFLELWYEDKNEIECFLKNHISHLKSGKYIPSSALMMSEALTYSAKLDLLDKDLLLRETSVILSEEQRRQLPDIEGKKYSEAISSFEAKDYKRAIELIKSLKKISDEIKIFWALSCFYERDLEDMSEILDGINLNKIVDDDRINIVLGVLFALVGKEVVALELFEKVKTEFQVEKYYQKGLAYNSLNRLDEAEISFRKAIELGDKDSYFSLVNILLESNKLKDAIELCEKGIQIGLLDLKLYLTFIYLNVEDGSKLEAGYKMIAELEEERSLDINVKFLYAHYYFEKAEFRKSIDLLLAEEDSTQEKQEGLQFLKYRDALLFVLVMNEFKDKRTLSSIIELKSQKEDSWLFLYSKSFLSIWNNNYSLGLELLNRYILLNVKNSSSSSLVLSNLLILLLSRKQYHSAYEVFNLEGVYLKDKYKPFYYALMHFMKDEFPNEYIKMGDELKEPVREVLEKVKQFEIDYK
jgi:tetratricopeptide (TPR) repeat protein